MSFRLHEHTADIRLEITAESFAGLFIESLKALNAVSQPVFLAGTAMRKIEVDAEDRLSLLVDFLNEVVYLSQVHHEAYERLTITGLEETHLEGIMEGKCISGMEEDIKAVTWHEASIIQKPGGSWCATLVLDI